MDGYQIFTDATSDLAPELTAGLPSVEMIPMNVEIGGTEYSYGSPEGITAKEFYRLQRAGNFATTSQINPTIYFKATPRNSQIKHQVLLGAARI